jgi:hypothetical protein
VVWLYRQSFFQKAISSYIAAISMPTDLDLSNSLIIIRIINRSDFNENERSDTSCYNHIGDPTIADATMDRLIHNAHRIQLKGGSMRRKQELDGN